MTTITANLDIQYFDEDAAMPNAITEIEVAAVKEKGKPWGVYLSAWEEYEVTPDVAKRYARALIIAALQAEYLNEGNSVEEARKMPEALDEVLSS
jgi:hypothetical protein